MSLLSIIFTLSLPLSIAHPHHHKRQDESSWAQITDPNAECAWYNYPPVNAIQANYPAPYDIAQILSNDTEAWSIFNGINGTITERLPNDSPRGTQSGDFSGVNYPAADPDCWWTYQGCTTPNNSTGIPPDIISVPEPNTWGLTIDDGPLCSHNAFYDFLAENNQKATLFYIGSNVMSYPLQAQRGFDDGHQICVHTWSHRYMTSLTNEQVFAELYYTRQVIKDLLGVTPKCWRPPYGDVDNRVRMFAMSLNLTTIVWDRDTADWTLDESNANAQTQATVDGNYESFISQAQSGQFSTYGPVVLSHELSTATLNEMMTFYPKIKSAFSHIVPIATAYNETTPYVETNWVYPTFEQYINGNINQTNTTLVKTSSTASITSATLSGDRSASKMESETGSTSASGPKTTGLSQKTKSGAASMNAKIGGWVMGVVVLIVAIVL